MKYRFILFALVALVFFADCKKHSVPTGCFVCNQYDSIINNGGWRVFPNGISDTQCDKNQGLITFYVETHVPYDTFFVHTDSQAYGYTDFHCDYLK